MPMCEICGEEKESLIEWHEYGEVYMMCSDCAKRPEYSDISFCKDCKFFDNGICKTDNTIIVGLFVCGKKEIISL